MNCTEEYAIAKVESLHSSFQFTGGDIKEEYPEQIMAVLFIKKDSKVLEIGSSIGRNTLIISSLLETPQNLVTLECNSDTFKVLLKNQLTNNLNFNAENCALSYRKLIQKEGNTIPDDNRTEWEPVNNITFEELESKYNIKFDTLVVDCESAFYYILLDRPDILNNITTVIMENDYLDYNFKIKVDEIIKGKGFNRVYVKAGGWGPCWSHFYEVWQK